MDQPTKVCTKCLLPFPATEEYFYRSSYKTHSLLNRCKRCTSAENGIYTQRRMAKRREQKDAEKRHAKAQFEHDYPGCKVCTGCGAILPATTEYFNRHRTKNNPNQLNAKCKTCTSLRHHLWYVENSEQVKDETKRRRKTDPEKYRHSRRQQYARNPTVFLARVKRWNKRHPEAQPVQKARRRTRERGLPSHFTRADWQFCLQWWAYRCAYCNAEAGLWTVLAMDHFIPLAAPTCPGTVCWNILPACHGRWGCNVQKNSKDPVAWLMQKLGARKAKARLAKIDAYFALVRERMS